MSDAFTPTQKQYLDGFFSGVQTARQAGGQSRPASGNASVEIQHEGPDSVHLIAQDEVTKSGKKLSDQEKWKREEHPFDAYQRLREQALTNELPKPPDNFRWRYFGLYNVAPAQNSFMCRMRIPNGILSAAKFAGVADLTQKFGGDYTHVTTRGNLQFREIEPKNAMNVIEGIQDLGLVSRGSGADNIRNVTGDATAGIAMHELMDTRSYAREWHFHILNDRSLFGLPRKFNVAFDGGGPIPTLEDTNDIGFQAIELIDGSEVWFRLILGGITGHKDLARDTGVIVKPNEATAVSAAIVKVFSMHGDRTSRNKARLKYVLDDWGFEKFLAAVEDVLGRKFTRIDAAQIKPRPAHDRLAHVGVHKQRQDGLYYIGVVLPVGKMSVQQMRDLAHISNTFGDGDIRLTVWQNLLISGVPEDKLGAAKAAIIATGLEWKATSIRAGLVACTGATGCKFAAAHTKENAEAIALHCETKIEIDTPINIHLTGCHHSCAQHYIGDIGMIGARVTINDDGDTVDGYHLLVGGGYSDNGKIARELLRDVKAEDAPQTIEKLLKVYVANRAEPSETFYEFTSRHDMDALKKLFQEAA
jgi:ferredoxin-nitrite reductase